MILLSKTVIISDFGFFKMFVESNLIQPQKGAKNAKFNFCYQ